VCNVILVGALIVLCVPLWSREPDDLEVDERAPMIRSFRERWQERARTVQRQ